VSGPHQDDVAGPDWLGESALSALQLIQRHLLPRLKPFDTFQYRHIEEDSAANKPVDSQFEATPNRTRQGHRDRRVFSGEDPASPCDMAESIYVGLRVTVALEG
jgi:hypothetical protein